MPESHFVLVYEPDIQVALFLEDAFRQQHLTNPTRILRHVSELQSYLRGAGVYANRELFPIPSLLLLDFAETVGAINLLEWLGRRGYLKRFPVIGLGNNVSNHVLQLAFDVGMNGFFEKDREMGKLAAMISELRWVDGWKLQLSDSSDVHLLTKEQFYRSGAA